MRDKTYDCGVHDVRQIVADYLRENGFDGLYNLVVDCACKLEDLAPCDCNLLDCKPGYLQPCPPDCGDHDWHMGDKKDD